MGVYERDFGMDLKSYSSDEENFDWNENDDSLLDDEEFDEEEEELEEDEEELDWVVPDDEDDWD